MDEIKSMKKSGLNLHLETIARLKEHKLKGVSWDYFLLELLKAWLKGRGEK